MKILELNKDKYFFILDENTKIPILEISRDDLFKIMNQVYEDKKYYDIENSLASIDEIKNPIEREVAKQLLEKMKEFESQVDSIKTRLDAQYPEA